MDETLASRVHALRHAQRRRAAFSVLATVAAGEAMFASFLIGTWFGPSRLRGIEIVLGSSIAFLGAVAWALVGLRPGHERGSLFAFLASEGARRRRVAVFPEHLTIDREPVLFAAIDRIEIDAPRLILRYYDFDAGGPVLRELGGPPSELKRLCSLVQDRPGIET